MSHVVVSRDSVITSTLDVDRRKIQSHLRLKCDLLCRGSLEENVCLKFDKSLIFLSLKRCTFPVAGKLPAVTRQYMV